MAELGDPAAQAAEDAEIAMVGLHVYPNPAQGEAIIVSDDTRNRITSLSISDLSGKVFATDLALPCSEYRLALEGLASGIYFLIVEINGKSKYHEKLVVGTGN